GDACGDDQRHLPECLCRRQVRYWIVTFLCFAQSGPVSNVSPVTDRGFGGPGHGDLGGARSVGRRLILGTNILIAYERGTIDRSSLDDDELAIASVSVAEYRVGIEMAATASRAAERARALVAPARPCPPIRFPAWRTRPDHRRPRGSDRPDHPEPRRQGALRRPPRGNRDQCVTAPATWVWRSSPRKAGGARRAVLRCPADSVE